MFSTLRTNGLHVARFALVALFAIAAFATSANAALHLYDPFRAGPLPGDYHFGNDNTGNFVLGGQNPVAAPTPFYSSPWIQSGGDSQAVRPGSLHYPNFPYRGGHVTDSVQFNCCSFGRSGREIAGGIGGGRNPQTIYQSFLVDFGNQGTDDPTQFGKRGVEWWNGGVGDLFLAVDLFVNYFSGVTDFRLAVTTPSGTNFAPLNGGGLNLANMAGTHLVVMKFDFDPVAADVVSVYLDPTDSIESNWTPAAVVAAPNSDLFISHHSASNSFTFSGGGHVAAAYDEVRWGDTFADVTPFIVPEPNTVLLALLATAFATQGRRRQVR